MNNDEIDLLGIANKYISLSKMYDSLCSDYQSVKAKEFFLKSNSVVGYWVVDNCVDDNKLHLTTSDQCSGILKYDYKITIDYNNNSLFVDEIKIQDDWLKVGFKDTDFFPVGTEDMAERIKFYDVCFWSAVNDMMGFLLRYVIFKSVKLKG